MDFVEFNSIMFKNIDSMEPVYVTGDEPKIVTVGTDITTLSEIFERGEF